MGKYENFTLRLMPSKREIVQELVKVMEGMCDAEITETDFYRAASECLAADLVGWEGDMVERFKYWLDCSEST